MHDAAVRAATRWRRTVASVAGVAVSMVSAAAWGAELGEAQKMYQAGRYEECLAECALVVARGEATEGWWVLKIRSELTTGRYEDALRTYTAAMERDDRSMSVRWAGYQALKANGRGQEAVQVLVDAREIAARSPWRFADATSRVALGRMFLAMGADPRQVLELFYDKAKTDSPGNVDAHLASGELALEKNDYALAAEAYAAAVKRAPDEPEAHLGLARAYENDGERATAALKKALELNPRHVDSLLYQADNFIDREAYAEAEELIAEALKVNGKEPRAWAYRAVMAHLAGDAKKEEECRAAGLAAWASNPEVDHLIGLKLSAKYRFAEGAEAQKRALRTDPAYRAAKAQLCQDLLRLGREDEGWALAAEVFAEDKYNVLAYNLETLHDTLSKFKTLGDGKPFHVRMEAREAAIYGDRVLKLLERANRKLSGKYGVQLSGPVTIEIFPEQKDFAIRTFGLPGGAGFLGVCFGPVVTVNSPASRAASPISWESIVWHEFCHTVTLARTRNKMSRWLSEGISVYEERLEQPAWGQDMTPAYRELILKGGATPVSKLSGAFLKPPTPMHLMFAYYESSMVVEYVVERWGLSAMQKVLADLGNGVAINDALARNTEEIGKLDEGFAKWLKGKAEAMGKDVDWERPELALDAGSEEMAVWNKKHPKSFFGHLGEGRALVAERKFKEAKVPLEKAAALYPKYGEAGGPYVLLAQVCRELGDAAGERANLEKHAALGSESLEARVRLMDLAEGAKDWAGVRKWAEEVVGINPLVARPWQALARAAEETGEKALAFEAHRTLLQLDPLDRAEHHYKLARLLVEAKDLKAARREVVMALEEAPRYRDAQKLLLEVVEKAGPTTRGAGEGKEATP